MSSKPSKLPKLSILYLSLLPILPGCATKTELVAAVDSSCKVFRPITWGMDDTKLTIEQIRAHNARWWTVCRKPQKPLA